MAYRTNQIEDVSLPLPIPQAARRLAQQFANQQPNPQKAEQVYLNTLAVCVVDHYLQLMDITTDLAASDSWNPVISLCVDIADLIVTGIGRLECRPMRAHEQVCYVPPDVWQDRVGYVAVQIDQPFREAILLGFTQTVATDELRLSQLQPLDGLLEHLSQLRQPIAASQAATSGRTLVNLSQWLQHLSETGWQTVEALLGTEPSPALSFRGADSFRGVDLDASETGVRLAKLINLGVQLADHPVALVVELRPEPDETSIRLQVHPTGSQTFLPPHLQLVVLDQSEAVFLEVEARRADNYIQLQFNGKPGEQFGVKVALGDDSVTEDFVI